MCEQQLKMAKEDNINDPWDVAKKFSQRWISFHEVNLSLYFINNIGEVKPHTQLVGVNTEMCGVL